MFGPASSHRAKSSSQVVPFLHQRAASLRVPAPTVDGQNILPVSETKWQPCQTVSTNRGLFDHDKFNPFYQMLASFVYRVRCSGAFDWKSKYRTCGARGVTKPISGRRRAQMLRNVARQSGGHYRGRWVYA
jgi:hypothetical protein